LSTRKLREREREREREWGKKTNRQKKENKYRKMQEKFRKKYIYEKQKTRRGERKPTGGRERERKGRASIKRSCNTTRARVPRQRRPATTTVTPPAPEKGPETKNQKEKNLFGTTVSITKNGNRQHSGGPFSLFLFLMAKLN